jgi:hypothetical protein
MLHGRKEMQQDNAQVVHSDTAAGRVLSDVKWESDAIKVRIAFEGSFPYRLTASGFEICRWVVVIGAKSPDSGEMFRWVVLDRCKDALTVAESGFDYICLNGALGDAFMAAKLDCIIHPRDSRPRFVPPTCSPQGGSE